MHTITSTAPTHLILLHCSDSIQFLHRTSSPAPHEHVFVDRCGVGAHRHGELVYGGGGVCANKRMWAELCVRLTSHPGRKEERRLSLPDSERRIQVWSSYTSCSTPRPRRRAREEHPRCCCKRQPGVQDTDGRKAQMIAN